MRSRRETGNDCTFKRLGVEELDAAVTKLLKVAGTHSMLGAISQRALCQDLQDFKEWDYNVEILDAVPLSCLEAGDIRCTRKLSFESGEITGRSGPTPRQQCRAQIVAQEASSLV